MFNFLLYSRLLCSSDLLRLLSCLLLLILFLPFHLFISFCVSSRTHFSRSAHVTLSNIYSSLSHADLQISLSSSFLPCGERRKKRRMKSGVNQNKERNGRKRRKMRVSGRMTIKASMTRSVILRILRSNANSSNAIENNLKGNMKRGTDNHTRIHGHTKRHTHTARDSYGWMDRPRRCCRRGMQWKPTDKDITRPMCRNTRTD